MRLPFIRFINHHHVDWLRHRPHHLHNILTPPSFHEKQMTLLLSGPSLYFENDSDFYRFANEVSSHFSWSFLCTPFIRTQPIDANTISTDRLQSNVTLLVNDAFEFSCGNLKVHPCFSIYQEQYVMEQLRHDSNKVHIVVSDHTTVPYSLFRDIPDHRTVLWCMNTRRGIRLQPFRVNHTFWSVEQTDSLNIAFDMEYGIFTRQY